MMRYFEDIAIGDEAATARRTITDADISWFCGLSGDFNPLHTDVEFIREHTPFRDRIAHGHLIMSITGGLRSELDDWRIVAYVDCRRRFVRPVYPGDTIRAVNRVTDVRPSTSRPALGVVTYEVRTVNQDDETVQEGTDVVLVERRSP